MTAEDLAIIRDVRRLLDKQAIDTNRVDIQVLKGGKVYLTGNVCVMRSQPTVNVKDEMEEFERRARKFPHIKEIFMNCRLVEPARKHGDNAEHAIKEHNDRVEAEAQAAETRASGTRPPERAPAGHSAPPPKQDPADPWAGFSRGRKPQQ